MFCSKCNAEIKSSGMFCHTCGARIIQPKQPPRIEDVNTSGMSDMGKLPEDLNDPNWGAFFLSVWWSIFNRTYIGLLCLIPFFGFIMSIILLIKGNEWAWRNRRFESKEEFKLVQAQWAFWGVVSAIISIIIGLASY